MQEYAIQIIQPGDAAQLQTHRFDTPRPGPGEVRVRQRAIGVNFVDIYHRTGLYPLPLPANLGVEAAGVVEAVGEGVTGFDVGQRVAYAGPPVGAYASARVLPAERLLHLPDTVSDDVAAASLLRGITVHMLLTAVRPIRQGDTLLVHAAAGGLGLLLVQWAKRRGARVIGTVGSEDKAQLALAHGLDHAVCHRKQDFVAEVMCLTDGQGVDFAVDGIGGDTLRRTLATVRPFGMVASVGQAGGSVETIPLADLGPARSIALARPSVFRYLADPARYQEAGRAVLPMLAEGVAVPVSGRLPLTEAARAHQLLESGQTTGALLLQP